MCKPRSNRTLEPWRRRKDLGRGGVQKPLPQCSAQNYQLSVPSTEMDQPSVRKSEALTKTVQTDQA